MSKRLAEHAARVWAEGKTVADIWEEIWRTVEALAEEPPVDPRVRDMAEERVRVLKLVAAAKEEQAWLDAEEVARTLDQERGL